MEYKGDYALDTDVMLFKSQAGNHIHDHNITLDIDHLFA